MGSPVPRKRQIELFVVKRSLNGYDQDREYFEYWLSRPVDERIAAVEQLRREFLGDDYEAEPGLPRSSWPVERREL